MSEGTGARSPYRAGLIGCGAMSRFHVPALQATPGVQLVALADPHRPALDGRGDQFGISRDHRYATYEEMLQRERLDLVAIATQAPVHHGATIAAVESGVRGVLCEKPIAMDLAQADEMITVCEAHGAVLAVNHWLRLTPAARRAAELIRDGAIGEPLAIRIHEKGGRPAGVALFELCTHLFDLARLLAGDAAWVQARLLTVDDGAMRPATAADITPSRVAWPEDRDCGLVVGDRCSATFGFHAAPALSSRGVIATFQSHFQPPGRTWRSGLEVFGLEGVLSLVSVGDGILELHLHRGAWSTPGRFEPVVVGDAAQHPWPRQLPASPELFFAPGIVVMLEELVRCIATGADHPSGGSEARASLEMIMGVFESHRAGLVSFPLAERGHPLQRWLAES